MKTAAPPEARSWKRTTRQECLVAPFELKSRDEAKRTFEGSLSTSHLDLGNGWMRDIVHPGAFKRWLKTMKADSPAYVPLLDSHNPWSFLNVFGHALSAEERLTGKTLTVELDGGKTLEVEEMFLDMSWQVIGGVDGDRLFDRLEPGSVRKMSMGYDPTRFDFGTLADGGRVRHLREVIVKEGSLVVFAMQPNAEVDRATVQKRFASLLESLTDEQRAKLAEIHPEFRALLDSPDAELAPKGDLPDPADEGLAPADPKRLELEARLRDLTLRALA